MWSLEGIPSRKLQVQVLPWAAYFVDRKVEQRGVRCTPTTPSPAGGWREEVRLVTKLGQTLWAKIRVNSPMPSATPSGPRKGYWARGRMGINCIPQAFTVSAENLLIEIAAHPFMDTILIGELSARK